MIRSIASTPCAPLFSAIKPISVVFTSSKSSSTISSSCITFLESSRSFSTYALTLSRTIFPAASDILMIFGMSCASDFSSVMMISAISEAWSPIRSISVIIFSAAEICLKSLATGCCWRSSFKQSLSISVSAWSISSSASITFCACSILPSFNAVVAFPIATSHNSPIRVSCSLSNSSCWSNRLRIS